MEYMFASDLYDLLFKINIRDEWLGVFLDISSLAGL